MTKKRTYHHGRIFRRGGPPSAAHPSLFSFVFCSMSSKEREVLFEEGSFFSFYVCCLLDSRTCSILFLLHGQLFCFLRQKKKRNLSPPRVYTRRRERSASRYPPIRSSRAERASFWERANLKAHKQRERERERERERKRRKRPAIENFSTYSIKWWQQLSRNARFRNCSRSKFALQLWVARLLRQNDARFISSETYVEWVLFLFFPLSLPRQNHSTTGLLGTSVLSSFASNNNTSSSSFFFPLLH